MNNKFTTILSEQAAKIETSLIEPESSTELSIQVAMSEMDPSTSRKRSSSSKASVIKKAKCETSTNERRKYALGSTIQQQTLTGGPSTVDLGIFLQENESAIRDFLSQAIDKHTCIKYYMYCEINFYRDLVEGRQVATAGFRTAMSTTSDVNSFSVDDVTLQIIAAIEIFNQNGSNWMLDYVAKLSTRCAAYRPLQGSKFEFKIPKELVDKRAVLNIENTDEYCFLYCIVAHIHFVEKHAERSKQYRQYFKELNYEGLTFPLKVSDVRKFEDLNPDIAVNVLFYENREVIPLHPSTHRHRKHTVNVLLLEHKREQHYVLVRTLSRLVAGRTKHVGVTHVCPSCLHPFSSEDCLARHRDECSLFPAQKVVYPKPGSILKFTNIFKQMKAPFVLYYDFESFLIPQNDDKVKAIHEPSGFCILRTSEFKEYEKPPYTYSGPDVINHFFDYLRQEEREIFMILNQNKSMIPLTPDQLAIHEASVACIGCKQAYTPENIRVFHHCHVTGSYIGSYCGNCNLQLKYRRTSNFTGNPSFHIDVVAHNAANYDLHLLIKKFRQYEVPNKKGEMKPVKISVIPSNTEKFMSVTFGNLQFKDSFQFLNSSLDTLTQCLAKDGIDKFVYTNAHFNNSPLVYKKAVYPYEYFTGPEVFQETQLPSIEHFYSALNDENISIQEYQRAQEMWTTFKCKTLQNFHDAYVSLDVCQLADTMTHFRNVSFALYNLDPIHYISLPGYSFDACLRMTGIQLQLISDPEHFLMLESAIRGGISQITTRHMRANNEFLVDKEEFHADQPQSCIVYLDANSLYSEAMSRPLPTGEFRLLSAHEIANLDVRKISKDSHLGYILEVKLQYPTSLHESHSDYPLCTDHLSITEQMLSPYSLQSGVNHVTCQKLTSTLYDKDHYILHYENLKQCLELGMILEKTYRVLEFQQSPWLKKYIDFNVDRRKKATSKFEQDMSKLFMNSVFGKFFESKRKQVNVSLVNSKQRANKLIAKPTCQGFKKINDDLVMIKMNKRTLLQDKPIYLGFSILDLSKQHMYDFHYNHVLKYFAERSISLSLGFSDTDSLCYQFQVSNIDDFISSNMQLFDTSNYPPTHPLYSRGNEKKVGCFKDELAGVSALEFVGLRPKCYSILISKEKDEKKVCKGVKRNYVSKNVRHQMYLDTLRNQASTTARFQNFQSRNHVIQTIEITKTCLSCGDTKRYILNDGVHTLAYGDVRIDKDV